MAAGESVQAGGRSSVRVDTNGRGRANVATGVPVLDHLIGLLVAYADFDLALEVAPGAALDEVAAAGRALGEGLAEPLRAPNARGHAATVVPADEALAHVALEASGRPLVVSNVDLSAARVGGLESDLVARFLEELAGGAGLTLHVRLVHGEQTQHVLEAIFKALGTALGDAAQPRRRKEA
jgi:imidazoleglycerol-phosphate dehydratase